MPLADDPRKHRQVAAEAIGRLRAEVRWKPNKDLQHLVKRKTKRHLPEQTTLSEYNRMIGEILNGADNLVYCYRFGHKDYYAVSSEVHGVAWLVLFGADGILETAFPPEDMADYAMRRGFARLGRIKEIIHD